MNGTQIMKTAVDVASSALTLLFVYILIAASLPAPGAFAFSVATIAAGFAVLAHVTGVSSQSWSFFGSAAIPSIAIASVGSAMLLALASVLSDGVVPLRVALAYAAFNPGILLATRLVRRYQVESKEKNSARERQQSLCLKKCLIIGAGRTGSNLVRDLALSHTRSWKIVGFLDDDPRKSRQVVAGVSVLGSTLDLAEVVECTGTEIVIIALPDDAEVTRALIAESGKLGLKTLAAPPADSRLETGSEAPARQITLDDLRDSREVRDTLISILTSTRKAHRVLVTGGAGYIGCHVVRNLLEQGKFVRVLDNFTFGGEGLAELEGHPNLEIVEGDVMHISDVTRSSRDVESVIALAAIVGDPACSIDAQETLNLNFEATKILADACAFYGVKRLVFASSCSVYGASADTDFLTEESPLYPVSLYARTRIMSEKVILKMRSEVESVILRLSTVYGLSPRMRFDLVVNLLSAKAVVDGDFTVFGGSQWRPFVHCADAARAFALAATARSSHVAGQIFNVGDDDSNYTIEQVGHLIADQVPCAKFGVQQNDVDMRNYRVRFNKINAIGYRAEYTVPKGITQIIDALASNPDLQTYADSRFSNRATFQEKLTITG